MAYNESGYEASKKYKAEKIKRVPLDMQIKEYELLKAAAEASGEKINQYIKSAIRERIARDGTPGSGYGISEPKAYDS